MQVHLTLMVFKNIQKVILDVRKVVSDGKACVDGVFPSQYKSEKNLITLSIDVLTSFDDYMCFSKENWHRKAEEIQRCKTVRILRLRPVFINTMTSQ